MVGIHNLPPQPTPFIGRAEELAKISVLLANPTCRLLTLVGPGGIGKTRLALEVARLQPDNFSDGIYLISLQPLGSPGFMVSTIAEVLGFQFSPGGEPKDQLLNYLQSKSILLVMDNFEHLLEGVVLVSEILSAALDLKILVTSREPLNVVEEWVFEVAGLNFPVYEDEAEIERYSAVELFLQNARRASAAFQLSEAHKRGVARICRTVGGMPLALELAAAWVRVMSCEQIAAEIEHSLDILETPRRNVSPRHRNMRAVFEPTWKHLPEIEQHVFMRLSVFRGGFTRSAAKAIAGASLPILAALVDKSLLRYNPDERYDIHELLRQYGEEQLTQSGSKTFTQDAHSAYYLEYLSQKEADIKSRRQLEALNEIEADFENIRVGWQWALRRKNYHALDQALESLFCFCEMRGRFQDGHELLGAVQERLAVEPTEELHPMWGRMLARDLWMLGTLKPNTENSEDGLEQSLAIARQRDNWSEIAFCLWLFGAFGHFTKDYARSIPLLEESLALSTGLDDRFEMARAADWLGAVYIWSGDYENSIRLSQQSLDWRRAAGDRFGMAASLMNLVDIMVFLGEYNQAKRYIEEMGKIYQELGSSGWVTRKTGYLSWIAFQEGGFQEAQALAEETLKLAADYGRAVEGCVWALSILGMLTALDENYTHCREFCERARFYHGPPNLVFEEGLAIAACGLEDYAAATHHFLKALEHALVIHDVRSMTHLLPVAAIMLTHEDQKLRAVELLGLAFHHPASARAWMEQWPLLTRLRIQLETELGAANYAAAWEHGKTTDLTETAKWLFYHFQPDKSPPSVQVSNSAPVEMLTERELEVLQGIAAGLSNAEIATQLVVEISTVKKHINHLYDKMGAKTRTQALVRAKELNLL